jgi:hypothetical protein
MYSQLLVFSFVGTLCIRLFIDIVKEILKEILDK